MPDSLKSAVTDFQTKFLAFDIDAIPKATRDLLSAGCGLSDFLTACIPCMEEIGNKFEAGEYYLPQLVVAGEMFKIASRQVKAVAATDSGCKYIGKIVLATPKGDIHDLGKDIFAVLAEASGFSVQNVGVDIEPKILVQEIEKTGATILGLSCLLTTTYASVRETVRLLEEKGLRNSTRIVIGGGATEKSLVEKLGVDAQTRDAYEGIGIIKSWAAQTGSDIETKEAVA
ncbi:MAG: cobalamin-dependent protein [Proteobacteria bacterium]|nr:cobalamin-dependent protein [Pseudomonadota bacterium]